MCGIAGFSLSPTSRQNARELAHALLSKIESRGHHASGFAYVTRDGKIGNYKQPKPGSQLSLAELPRNAKTVILHTRYATQGDPADNRNNHPVISTDNKVALVHNGVINNDDQLREPLGITDRHGKVDSLVIPTLIANHGVNALNRLAGYAAIAWINASERNIPLHIARLKNSPTAYTYIADGSFVFASTQPLLRGALAEINLFHGGVFDIPDGRMIEVQDGFIMEHEASPIMSYSYQTYQRYSGATSGGHATGSGTNAGTTRSSYQPPLKKDGTKSVPDNEKTGPVGAVGSEVVKVTTDAAKITGSEDAPKSDGVEGYYADLEEWRKRKAKRDVSDQATALKALEQGPTMALGMTSDLADDDYDDESDWETYIANLVKTQEAIEAERKAAAESQSDHETCTIGERYAQSEPKEGYYIIDSDGDISGYPTLDDLEARLRWLSKRTMHEGIIAPDVADEIKWCNFIMDIGHLDDDGAIISWVDDMAEIDEHESPAVRNLQYIRDGISRVAAAIKG